MVKLKEFFNIFKSKKIVNFYGVPDSLLKDFIEYLNNKKDLSNIISVNEGAAVSSAIGHYLASKKMACVYMQNSGLSNALNPLISIADKKVYSIPLILIIGWRGSPNIKDEPQHKMMGRVTLQIMKLFDIKTLVVKSDHDLKKVSKLISFSVNQKKPVALVVEPKKFSKISAKKNNILKTNKVFRPDAIELILKNAKRKTKIISTVG